MQPTNEEIKHTKSSTGRNNTNLQQKKCEIKKNYKCAMCTVLFRRIIIVNLIVWFFFFLYMICGCL